MHAPGCVRARLLDDGLALADVRQALRFKAYVCYTKRSVALYGTVRGRPGLSPYVAWDTCGRHVVVALRDVLLLMGRVWWKVALGACHVGRALQYLWHLGTCARWVVAPTYSCNTSQDAAPTPLP